MRAIATLTAAAAMLALTGCDRLGIGGANAAGNETANASANQTADSGGGKDPAGAAGEAGKDPAGGAIQASAGGPPPLDRDYIIGRWTDDGDCSNSGQAAEFGADGSFAAANGGGGLWHLDGDRLTMTGPAGTNTLRIVPVDQDTMTVINPDGSLGRSTRC
jgi:hypothetical protein